MQNGSFQNTLYSKLDIFFFNTQGTIELKEMVEIVGTLYDMEGVKGVGKNYPKPFYRSNALTLTKD